MKPSFFTRRKVVLLASALICLAVPVIAHRLFPSAAFYYYLNFWRYPQVKLSDSAESVQAVIAGDCVGALLFASSSKEITPSKAAMQHKSIARIVGTGNPWLFHEIVRAGADVDARGAAACGLTCFSDPKDVRLMLAELEWAYAIFRKGDFRFSANVWPGNYVAVLIAVCSEMTGIPCPEPQTDSAMIQFIEDIRAWADENEDEK